MKTTPFLKRVCWLIILVLGTLNVSLAQNNKKAKDSAQAATIRLMVNEQRYFFLVQSVSPSRGGLRQLTPGYYLSVNKDTVSSELPYFGRSQQAGYGNSDGSLKFTSLQFEYKNEPGKKNSWNITITPNDVNNCREMKLIIYDNGTASLNVISNQKDPISFRGYIADKKS